MSEKWKEGMGERGILRRAARSTPLMRLSPYVTCSVRLGSRGARVPKDNRAGVGEMNSHLKLLPLQATPTQKMRAPGAQVNRQSNNSTKPRGVYSPVWSLLADNRVAEGGNPEVQGKVGWEEKTRWRGRGLKERLVEEGEKKSCVNGGAEGLGVWEPGLLGLWV